MAEREIKTTPFMSGQQTNAKSTGPTKTPLKSNVSKVRNAGQPDPLAQALTKPPPILPEGNHMFRHSKTSRPGGAHYNPAGEFGRPSGRLNSKATGMGSHTSRPGHNPLGSPRNDRGGNPLGGSGGKGTFRGNP